MHHLEARRIATHLLFAGTLVRQPAYQDVASWIVGDLRTSDFVMNQTLWIGLLTGLTPDMLGLAVEPIHTRAAS